MGVRVFKEFECDVCGRLRSLDPEQEPDPPKDWNVQGDFVTCPDYPDCAKESSQEP